MEINFAGFLSSLKLMAYGLLGIIVVMVAIYIIVALMMKVGSRKAKQ